MQFWGTYSHVWERLNESLQLAHSHDDGPRLVDVGLQQVNHDPTRCEINYSSSYSGYNKANQRGLKIDITITNPDQPLFRFTAILRGQIHTTQEHGNNINNVIYLLRLFLSGNAPIFFLQNIPDTTNHPTTPTHENILPQYQTPPTLVRPAARRTEFNPPNIPSSLP